MPDIQPAVENTTQIIDRNWLEYGNMMAANFRSERLTFESLSAVKSFRNCLLETYNVLVRFEMVEKLEVQEQAVKEELWAYANQYKGEMTKSDMIVFCKCVLVIEVLLKD